MLAAKRLEDFFMFRRYILITGICLSLPHASLHAEDRFFDSNGVKISKAHVVGYSMGAMIANKLLVTHSERMLTVTLGGAAGLREASDLSFIDPLAAALDDGSIGPLMIALTPPGKPKPTAEQINSI